MCGNEYDITKMNNLVAKSRKSIQELGELLR